MWLTIPSAVAGLVLVVGAALLIRTRRESARRRRLVRELMSGAERGRGRFSRGDLEGVPEPVRRYLGEVLEEGGEFPGSVSLRQRGEFRLGETWREMEAEQVFTLRPPGFVWTASIRVLPFVSARVVDSYVSGTGSLRATVLSFAVSEGESGPDLDAGELTRYLGEAVWFPEALLPGSGVEWDGVDEASARATLRHGGTEVSLVFHFGGDHLVERVTGTRPRSGDGGFEDAGFTGRWGRYRELDGVLVPTEGEAEWDDEGEPYWRGRVTGLTRR